MYTRDHTFITTKKICPSCGEQKEVSTFPVKKGKQGHYGRICLTCEQRKQEARRHRLQTWQAAKQEQRARKQEAWERSVLFRNACGQRQQDIEQWFHHQPDRQCPSCQQWLPARAFRDSTFPNTLTLRTRCIACHAYWRRQHHPSCCLCQQQLPRTEFLLSCDGYALCDSGVWLSLCCQSCGPTFEALSPEMKRPHIHQCCQKTFPDGQVIYAEVDPEEGVIRYIGRTNKPKRRHAQHLVDILPPPLDTQVCLTRSQWMYTLAQQGLTPSMQILRKISIAPLVVEWEQRYIFHGLQQGWKLLNMEHLNTDLRTRIQSTSLDFLNAPFAELVQQGFFEASGLIAFLHLWYHAA